jgi:hypothetical protein
MREKLNNNPKVQMGVLAVLLLFGAIFVITSMGGGEGGSSSGEEAAASLSASSAPAGEGPAPSPTAMPVASSSAASSALAARPLPAAVVNAWKRGDTVTLLIVHEGGIDDDLVKRATSRLGGMPKVANFVVPADKIARYAAITEGAGVERVPALVVLEPRSVDHSAPAATVSYGFQSDASIVQAVRDADYKGPTVEYHP